MLHNVSGYPAWVLTESSLSVDGVLDMLSGSCTCGFRVPAPVGSERDEVGVMPQKMLTTCPGVPAPVGSGLLHLWVPDVMKWA